MQHGLFSFPTDDSIDPASLARLAEDAGFDSLFFPDHTHIPASRETPFPGGEPLGASTRTTSSSSSPSPLRRRRRRDS